jgi:hypothetical protein
LRISRFSARKLLQLDALTQEPKLLRPKFRRDEVDTGDVAARPVEAGDKALSDWVAPAAGPNSGPFQKSRSLRY